LLEKEEEQVPRLLLQNICDQVKLVSYIRGALQVWCMLHDAHQLHDLFLAGACSTSQEATVSATMLSTTLPAALLCT
jgi:hypothetical protein